MFHVALPLNDLVVGIRTEKASSDLVLTPASLDLVLSFEATLTRLPLQFLFSRDAL